MVLLEGATGAGLTLGLASLGGFLGAGALAGTVVVGEGGTVVVGEVVVEAAGTVVDVDVEAAGTVVDVDV
ncbi:MAG TPA: hypothetical protein VGG23_02910, partial [Acidimicrobiales bacterium]